MKKIEDSELNEVNGGGDQDLVGGGALRSEVDLNQDGGSGDEDEQDTAIGRTDGGQQHLG